MAPKKPINIFHPKKKPIQRPKEIGPDGKLVDKFVPILPSSKAKPEEDEITLPPDDHPYQDFKLMSSALNGWKYDIMKLDSRTPIELTSWAPPIKLNRKELRREDDGSGSNAPVAVDFMRGPDGKPVFGPDGRKVMVDAEGRPIRDGDGAPAKGKGAANGGRKKFQKKTKQVFKVPEEVRALRREERYPWTLEDSTGGEVWVGQLEDMNRAEQIGAFMPAANNTFQFVPVHRWYKFSKRLKHSFPTDTAMVEAEYQKQQKRDPAAWLQKVTGHAPSAATQELFNAQREGRYVGVAEYGESRGPGGRRLQTVSRTTDLFGDGDDDEDAAAARRRREAELGADADMDEMLYEDDVADDDGQAAVDPADQDDEEAKEVEERLKREYIQANKMRDGYIDADDDEMPTKISKSAKRMQRMIRQREGNNAYESDDDENPYASSEEEESEEEELLPSQAPLTQPPPGQPPTQPPQASKLATNGAGPANAPHDSRPGSPVSPTSPSLGGHSIVAMRATSPKFKQTVPSGSGSRAGSPLAGAARGGSPSGGRAGSPVANGQASSNKRKAPEDGQSPTPGAPPRTKKRKHAPLAPLEDRHVIDWLREHDKVTTRECIQHFTPYLKDEGVKAHFTRLVKEVAQLKAGQLVLKAQYREPGSAPPVTPSAA